MIGIETGAIVWSVILQATLPLVADYDTLALVHRSLEKGRTLGGVPATGAPKFLPVEISLCSEYTVNGSSVYWTVEVETEMT